MSEVAAKLKNRGMITATVMLAAIMTMLDSTIANVALPHMSGEMSASTEQINWVLTSYIIAAAIMTPITGWLAGRLGVKRMFLIAIIGFTAASAACGAAQNLAEIVVFRILQGAFGAGMMPLSQAVMLDIYSGPERGQAMAVWGMGVTLGPIMGPLIGGWLTDDFSWRWIFYINLPLGVICILGALAFMPRNKPMHRRPLDRAGFLLLAVAMAAIQLMLDRGQDNDWFSATETVVEAVVGLIALWLFVTHTLTASRSFLPAALLADRNFVAASTVNFFIGIIAFPIMAIVPQMMETQFDYPVLTTGLVSAPRGISGLISMFVMGRIINRVDPRLLILIGLTFFALSFRAMSFFTPDMDWRPIAVAGIIQGVGVGMVFTPITMVAFGTLRPDLTPEATGFFALLRGIGNSAGISLMETLLYRLGATVHERLTAGVDPSQPGAMGLLSLDPHRVNLEIDRQAAIVAYTDIYQLLFWITLATTPLLLILRPPKAAVLVPASAE